MPTAKKKIRFALFVLLVSMLPWCGASLWIAWPHLHARFIDPPTAGESEQEIRARFGAPFEDSRRDQKKAGARYELVFVAPDGRRFRVVFGEDRIAKRVSTSSR